MFAISLLAGITSCSSAPKIQEFADTANSADELASFSKDMETANARQVNVLAPNAYERAQKSLKYAVSSRDKGKDSKVVLHQIAEGRAHLDRANQFAEISRTNMEGVVNARQAALTAGADKSFADDFNDADDNLKDVTSDIEDNDLREVASNRAKLQEEYLNVELKAIELTNLGPARATIALAVKEGAKEHAKQSFAIAEKSVNDTQAYIVAHRHEDDEVRSRAQASTAAADHLLKITRASKAGKSISSEQAALLLESEQLKTEAGQVKLAQQQQVVKNLAAETGDLRSQQAFNKSFEAARAQFTGKEAEVYRKGNQLVIRLRTMEFPVNQSVLRESNFPLLAKVVKVVKGFEGPTKVVIEGHTDSDGGQELNKKLSTERSNAISSYLVANEAIDQANISAVGYGFEHPLASNKTAKGKAQNRRVDVIITPQETVTQ